MEEKVIQAIVDLMKDKDVSFECYCAEVENIPFYNYLTDSEYEAVYERYLEYIGDDGDGLCTFCSNESTNSFDGKPLCSPCREQMDRDIEECGFDGVGY